MKKYRVKLIFQTTETIEVEATDREDAELMAWDLSNTDGAWIDSEIEEIN